MSLPERGRFRQVDETTRGAHSHLEEDDVCLYLWEYTSNRDYTFSATNSLIKNLKIKPSLAATPRYGYKIGAINHAADAMKAALNPDWLQSATLIPVPPSKDRAHPEYDDRMERICRRIAAGSDATVSPIVVQRTSMIAAHESVVRPTVDELVGAWHVDTSGIITPPRYIGIVDDVLTAGTHYKAMQRVLRAAFPGVPLTGLFVARRVFPEPDPSLLFTPL